MSLLTRIGKFLRPMLTTIQSKRHCSLSCHVNWNTHKLSVAYVSFPALVATSIVAVLQAPDGKNNIFCSSVQYLYPS